MHTELQPGAVIGSRFELLERIGSGGMGVVFRAQDRILGVTTALKVLDLAGRRGESSAAEHVRRFRSEILLARQVRHPNVCAIYEYGEDQGQPYFTMELVEGQDLRRMLAGRGSLMGQEAYVLALEVAAGLEAIHAVGIVHRDLKPANIMLGLDGRVRLMDFGLAKAWEGSDPGLTRTGSVVGSPAYMSPEQIRGNRLDARSDLYSLAIVIFELFTGRLPFECDGARAAMLAHLEQEPLLDDPLLPRPLEAVLRRALAKDPAERQESVTALVRDISQARRAGLVGTTDFHEAESPAPPRSALPPTPPPEAALLLPNLIRASRHGDAALRLRAVTAIGWLGSIDPESESALRVALDDPEPAVRVRASAGLERRVARERSREASESAGESAPALAALPPTPPSEAGAPSSSRDPGSGDAPTEIRRPRPAPERQDPGPSPELSPPHRDEREPASAKPEEPSLRWPPGRALVAGLGLVVILLFLWLAFAEKTPEVERERPPDPPQGAAPDPASSTRPEAGEASVETGRIGGEARGEPVVGPTALRGPEPPAETGGSADEAEAGPSGPEAAGGERPDEPESPAGEPPVGESAPAGGAPDSPVASSLFQAEGAEAPVSVPAPPPDGRAGDSTPAPTPAPTPTPPVVGALVADPDTLPRLLDPEPPEYPPVALQRRVEETVMLRVLIDENGRVLEVEELPGRSARPEFLRSATDWVRRQTYAPATRLGVPVRFWMVQPVVYELNP